MGSTGTDFGGLQSLSSVWSSESRGPRLQSHEFETKPLIRAGGNAVEAILVVAVSMQTGVSADGVAIATYPVYAAIAVDQARLSVLSDAGVATDRHTTMTDAAQRASDLNATSETTYLNDYQSGALSHVAHWEKSQNAASLQVGIGIAVRPAANQSANQSGMKS